MEYSVARCKRGHVISRSVVSVEHREFHKDTYDYTIPIVETHTLPGFCGTCGAAVIATCEHCDAPLHAKHVFCRECGAAHPWATREQRIQQVQNLLDSENLSEADRLRAVEALDQLASADVEDKKVIEAGKLFRRLAPNAWKAGEPVLQGVLTAYVKAQLGLP